MFTAAEFRLIRENCPGELQKLLAMLNIKEPNWQGDDEFRIYEKLDDEIVNRVCRTMKSESVIEGYLDLMKFGGLPFDYSETDNELLATILQNTNSVARGATQALPIQQTLTETRPQKITKTVEKKVLLPFFIFAGIALIIAGVVLSDSLGIIGAVILGLIGFTCLGLGFNGKTIKETVEVDGTPLQVQVHSEKKVAAFTNAEIQQVFQVLNQINKIVNSI